MNDNPETFLVTDEAGAPLGMFNRSQIEDDGARFAFALASVCNDRDAMNAVTKETLDRVGSAAFGYVCANALRVMADILDGALQVTAATGTDLRPGIARIAAGQDPSTND